MSTVTRSLKSWAVHEVVTDHRAQAGVGMLAFVLAMVFGAQVAIPLPWTPVPATLQPLVVILAGVALGPRLAAAAMAIYLSIGAMGAPVFSAGGAGLPWLLGPTGGYLVAMPAAAYMTGFVAGERGRAVRTLAGLVTGIGILYLGGITQLFLLTGQGLGELLALAVLPFLAGDATKILLALALTGTIRKASLGRR
jgi:biotin transport system substrate-specific component